MEFAIQIICGLILAAFVLRVLIGSFKIIYKIAPFVIILAAVIALMYWFETGRPITELKDQNATIIGTTEN